MKIHQTTTTVIAVQPVTAQAVTAAQTVTKSTNAIEAERKIEIRLQKNSH